MATINSVDEAENCGGKSASSSANIDRAAFPRRDFEAGKTLVPVAGRVR